MMIKDINIESRCQMTTLNTLVELYRRAPSILWPCRRRRPGTRCASPDPG